MAAAVGVEYRCELEAQGQTADREDGAGATVLDGVVVACVDGVDVELLEHPSTPTDSITIANPVAARRPLMGST